MVPGCSDAHRATKGDCACVCQRRVRPAVRMRQGHALPQDSVQDGPLSSDLALGLRLDWACQRRVGVGGARRHGTPPAAWGRAGRPL